MTDVSPAGERQQPKNTRPDSLASHLKTDNGLTAEQNKENEPFDDLRQGGRNTKSNARTENEMSHWRPEETPEKVHKIYKTAGDGMGGRKDAGRDWMIGGEQPEVKQAKIYKTYGNGMGGRRDAAPEWSWGDRDDQVVPQQSKDSKMYKTAGNGMGSRTARNLSDEHDDDDYADAGHNRSATTKATSRKANDLSTQAAQELF